MNAPNENAPNENAPSENEDSDASPAAEAPLTVEEWDQLRAPFSRGAYIVDSRAVGRTPEMLAGDDDKAQSVIDLRLRPTAIRDRLDLTVGPARWSYRFEPGLRERGHHSVFCHLHVGPTARTGIGADSNHRGAGRIALAGAAEAFGIGASGQASGPVDAEMEVRHHVPDRTLKALEKKDEPFRWAPDKG